jgi:hypothetical protein
MKKPRKGKSSAFPAYPETVENIQPANIAFGLVGAAASALGADDFWLLPQVTPYHLEAEVGGILGSSEFVVTVNGKRFRVLVTEEVRLKTD